MSISAARVFVTLDELAAALGVPEGHRIEAVTVTPGEYRPGIALAVVGSALPTYHSGCALQVIDLQRFRNLLSIDDRRRLPPEIPRGTGPKPLDVCRRRCGGLLRLRVEGLRCDKCGADDQGNIAFATPPSVSARPALTVSDQTKWPTFPGQDLDYRGLPETPDETRGDPGDEDIHTGGPR